MAFWLCQLIETPAARGRSHALILINYLVVF